MSREPDVDMTGLVEIGRVTRPHGVRGEVRVHLHWPDSDTLEHVDSIILIRRGERLVREIVSARHVDKAVLMRIRGLDDRDAAESLRDCAVCVPRSALPPPEEGEYYLHDLIGARVEDSTGTVVGEVVEVRVHPSVDTLVVRTPDGRTLEQAIAEPWIARIDAEKKVVELSTTDGLI